MKLTEGAPDDDDDPEDYTRLSYNSKDQDKLMYVTWSELFGQNEKYCLS